MVLFDALIFVLVNRGRIIGQRKDNWPVEFLLTHSVPLGMLPTPECVLAPWVLALSV